MSNIKTLALVGAVLTLLAAVAGCASTPNSTAPTVAPPPDYAGYLNRTFAANGWTPTRAVTDIADNQYGGAYNDPNGQPWSWTITIAANETAAKTLYSQIVVQKTDDGFVNNTPANASRYLANVTIIEATSAAWYGHSANSATSGSTVLLAYGYSHEIDQWLVANGQTDSANAN